MALHTTRRLAQRGWQHTKRAIGTVSEAADKATPFYTKYVHPVLDANPETRTLAKIRPLGQPRGENHRRRL